MIPIPIVVDTATTRRRRHPVRLIDAGCSGPPSFLRAERGGQDRLDPRTSSVVAPGARSAYPATMENSPPKDKGMLLEG